MTTFGPDLRNPGGQNMLTHLVTNHYASLCNAKPVVNSHAPTAKSGARKVKQGPDLTEVLVSLKKVEKVSAYTDHSKPETFTMAQNLSKYKQRKQKTQKDSHSANLQNMQQRIDRYSNPIEQKKNEFNYKENPVTLFRQSESKGSKVVIHNKKEGDIYTILKKKTQSKKKVSKINFKEYLLKEIVDNQIWTDEDLESLFESTKEKFSEHDQNLIDEAIVYVKSVVL